MLTSRETHSAPSPLLGKLPRRLRRRRLTNGEPKMRVRDSSKISRPPETLHFPANRRSHASNASDQILKIPGEQSLFSIALCLLGSIMNLYHNGVCTSRNCCKSHRRNELAEANSMRWVNNDRQMRLGL